MIIRKSKILLSVIFLLIYIVMIFGAYTSGNPDSLLRKVSFIRLISIGFFIILGLGYMFLNYPLVKSSPMNIIIQFWLFYMFINPLLTTINQGYIKDTIQAVFWPVSYFVFYVFMRKHGELFGDILKYLFLLAAILSVAVIVNRDYRKSEDAGINVIFYVLTLLPFLLHIRNRTIRNLIIFYLLILSLLAMKRSVLIILGIFLVLYGGSILFRNPRRILANTILSVLLVISVLLVSKTVNDRMDNAVLKRVENIKKDEGNGRLTIYNEVMYSQLLSSPYEWIFGHGNNSVNNTVRGNPWSVGRTSHNDFLEILFNYGLLGFLIYLFLHFKIAHTAIKLKKSGSEFFLSYLSSYIIFLVMSLVSHLVIYPTYFIFLAIYWGIIESLNLKEADFRTNELILWEKAA